MGKDIVIDYDAIQAHLAECDAKDPDRTRGPLDSLLAGLNSALAHLVNGDPTQGRSVCVTLDDINRDVTVFGKEIKRSLGDELLVNGLISDLPTGDGIYRLFTQALEAAKEQGIYTKFFRALPKNRTSQEIKQ